MSQAQYKIYLSKVFSLAKTLVVKSSAAARAINTELVRLGHTINENDPASWKYYLHLNGEYHYTDRVMKITSLDTQSEITFNKNALTVHLATAREYASGGQYYKTLVSQFPDQEDLIRGILNPVDISTAIAAEDGQILYYNPALVEENEENLIPKLEQWCKDFSRRWFVRAYTLVDDLYVAAHLSTMYTLIPMVVTSIRAANCHTNYAHSFHIREYLNSHQYLGDEVDYLTTKQRLWLYRQIRFLERNAGKQSTFKELVKNLLTERNLPLSEWNMRHDLSKMPDEELGPRASFYRESLNMDLSIAGVETRNITEMLEAEIPVARNNERAIQDNVTDIRKKIEHSQGDFLKTKVLESSVLDLSDAGYFSLADTMLNHWLYLSQVGRYTAVISVENPANGGNLVLSAKEAFIVFLYVFNKSMGIELVDVPVLQANNVRKLSTPLRPEIEGMIDKKLLNPYVVDGLYKAIDLIPPIISTEAFNRTVAKIHEGLQIHRWIWTTREHKDERGQVEAAAMHFYHDWTCRLDAPELYPKWLSDRGLDLLNLTRLECSILAEQLISRATGADLFATYSVRDIQTAMLRLMTQLSSYSIQFLQSINPSPIIFIDWQPPRIGNIEADGGDDFNVDMATVYVEDIHAQGLAKFDIQQVGWLDDMDLKARGYDRMRIESDINATITSNTGYFFKVEIPQIDVVGDEFPESLITDITKYTEHYLPQDRQDLSEAFDHLNSPHYALTQADKDELTERWNERPADPPITLIAEGLQLPNLYDEISGVDVMRTPTLTGSVSLPTIDYPLVDGKMELDTLLYPGLVMDIVLDVYGYPVLRDVAELDGLRYPMTQQTLVLDTLTYPHLNMAGELDGLDYPEYVDSGKISEFTYPFVLAFNALDGLSFGLNGSMSFNTLDYPPVPPLDLDTLDYPQ